MRAAEEGKIMARSTQLYPLPPFGRGRKKCRVRGTICRDCLSSQPKLPVSPGLFAEGKPQMQNNRLWYYLRDRHLGRLQVSQAVCDWTVISLIFCCYEQRLVIELDGGQHAKSEELMTKIELNIWKQQGFRVDTVLE